MILLGIILISILEIRRFDPNITLVKCIYSSINIGKYVVTKIKY